MPGMPRQAPCSNGTISGSGTARSNGTTVYSAAVPNRTVGLSPVAPHAPSDPFPRHPFAHDIHRPRAIAVGNDARIGHPDSKRILALFHVARIYAGSGNANPNFTGGRLWLVHLTDGQDISCSALLFIPGRFHRF